ncbi:hypothetical protein [Clostridium merdae]|uniref:hypothetical protein n=1 Tax=Clostridium merdae TaxID=1958780 RepID=UPI000A269056|nr:hypothetical protein [Clostridium merdae]
MAQGIFGGATSYEEQSLHDILEDIIGWINYTNNKKNFILEQKNILHQSGFWDKIAFDFQLTVISTISYFNTILFDLTLIKSAIENSCITEKEVNLLRSIGQKSVEFNREYGQTYKGDLKCWRDYGNPDFKVAEEIYGRGRDYFVTMQDAGNAAARLEDYMEKGQVINTLYIGGDVIGSHLLQGINNSAQSMVVENNFDYEQVLKILYKINKSFESDDFLEDFGDKSDEIKKAVADAIKMVKRDEEPSKIKKALNTIKELAIEVSGSLISSGISALITQLPIW